VDAGRIDHAQASIAFLAPSVAYEAMEHGTPLQWHRLRSCSWVGVLTDTAHDIRLFVSGNTLPLISWARATFEYFNCLFLGNDHLHFERELPIR